MGDVHELIARLEATPRVLAHLALEVSDELLDRVKGNEWSARTVLAHFRDLESLVMRQRLARMLVEDEPTFPDFDESRWAGMRNRSRDRKEQLLGDFALQRQASLAIVRRLSPDQLRRAGRHEDGTPWTVERWLGRWVEHERDHVAQLEATLGTTLHEVLERRARAAGSEGHP